MKKYKDIIFLLAFCIISYMQVKVSFDSDLINIYDGVVFKANISYYMNWFFIFACYSLYMYEEFYTYIREYGVLLVTREKSRDKLLLRLLLRLAGRIMKLECIRIITFICFDFILKGNVSMKNAFDFIKMLVLTVLVFTIILFVQMMIEVYYSANTAVIISMAYFLVSMSVSDIIAKSEVIPSKINVIFLPNLLMKVRIDTIIKNPGMHFVLIGFLVLILMVMMVIIKQKFRKKDII